MERMKAGECGRCGGPISVVDPAWLRARRKAAGLSLRGVARRLGLSAGYLCDIERGRRDCTDAVAEGYAALEDKPTEK